MQDSDLRPNSVLAGVRGSRTHLPRSPRGIMDLKSVPIRTSASVYHRQLGKLGVDCTNASVWSDSVVRSSATFEHKLIDEKSLPSPRLSNYIRTRSRHPVSRHSSYIGGELAIGIYMDGIPRLFPFISLANVILKSPCAVATEFSHVTIFGGVSGAVAVGFRESPSSSR